MDYNQALEILKQRRAILDTTILTLERLVNVEAPAIETVKTERRGRKNMAPEERQIVSARMKQYWAARRNAQRANS